MRGVYGSRLSPYLLLVDNHYRFNYKLGRSIDMSNRGQSEASETLCCYPTYYLDNMMFWEVEDDVYVEMIIHRELDSRGLRCNPGAKKEIFYDVTHDDIDTILTREGISYTKCSYREYQIKENPYQMILNGEFQDNKIVMGKQTSNNKGEVERCKILTEKSLCVKEIVKKTNNSHRLCLHVNFEYTKSPEKKLKYSLGDFKWDIEHGYLAIENE